MMIAAINLRSGDKFGPLTILDNIETVYRYKLRKGGINTDRRSRKCLCSCGAKVFKDNRQLDKLIRIGFPLGCGKNHKFSDKENKLKALRVQAENIKTGALAPSRGKIIKWELTIEETMEIISQRCFYCDMEPSNSMLGNSRLNGKYFCNGIDRLSSKEGYTRLNCVPCCRPCNFAKNGLSLSAFLDKVKRIYEHINLQNLPLTENLYYGGFGS